MNDSNMEENSMYQIDNFQAEEQNSTPENRAIIGGVVVIPGISGGIIIPDMSVCKVRFLNAVEDSGALRVVVGSRLITNNLTYTNVTEYNNIPVGFRRVIITSASSPRAIMYQATIPFNAGEVITLAIVKSPQGLDLIRISDINITSGFRGRGSMRMANLVLNSPPLDLFLTNHRVIFSDVRYKEVTQAKQAQAKEYDMYIARTPYVIEPRYNDIEVIEDMPIITPYSNSDPLVSFSVNIKSGVMSTIYVFGGQSHITQVRVIDNQ